jgi:hypothetical protein
LNFTWRESLRREYQLEDSFFSTNGNIIFTNFNAVRVFVHKLNTTRDPRNKVYPGEVNALGLLEEIFHFVLREYEKQLNPKVFSKAVKHLQKIFGEKKLHEIYYMIFRISFLPQIFTKDESPSPNTLKRNP